MDRSVLFPCDIILKGGSFISRQLGCSVANVPKDLSATIQQALSTRRSKRATVLSSLLAVEDAIGYIPSEAIQAVAQHTEATINDVWGVASFYTNFRFTPPGEHTVEVCWGPSCHLMGASAVVKAVMNSLGLTTEGETSDRRVTFKYNTCLGACAQAPVVSVDQRLIGRILPEEAEEQVQRLCSS